MSRRSLAVFFVVGALALAGCARTVPVLNVKDAAIGPRPGGKVLTMEQVAQAISIAGKRLGWNIVEVRPGTLDGTLRLRQHTAAVAIVHDTTRFSITYKDSTNLRYRDGTIHRNYNNWIQNLERQIVAEITALSARN
jgi:hypothetical protein